jgi:hypothetical protein
VIIETSEQKLKAAYSDYALEFRRLRRSGELTDRAVTDFEHHDILDGEMFPKLKELWERCLHYQSFTEEAKAAAARATDASTVAFPLAAIETDESDPLGEAILAKLPSMLGKHKVADVARGFNHAPEAFLASFRHVRSKLQGCKAFECSVDGVAGLEVVQ